MSIPAVRDDLPTLAAIGVLAALAATVSHEVAGHGLGCLAVGGDIRLITTIFFRCTGGTAVTDLGGPLGNLALGLVALSLTANRRIVFGETRLFLLLTGGLALFWFFAQLVVDGLAATDDWNFAAGQLGWPPSWRVFAVGAGILGYDLTRRGLTRGMRTLSTGQDRAADRRRILVPWLTGMVAVSASAALFAGDRPGGIRDTVLTLGAMPLGLSLAVVLAARFGPTGESPPLPTPRRWSWIAAAVAAYVAFCLIIARGLGPGPL
jgi:hypothetical protein